MSALAHKPTAPRASRANKGDRIEARLSREAKTIIEHAASLEGVSASDFIVSHAQQAARQVISEHERWRLDRNQSEAFVHALLHPPEPNEALVRAAERYKAR
ncbi:MAG: DUF1778 domain-containing protein [Acidobacteria bacterium]|nr:DUF1778 domain-containing protein [Acidobacteriota bacterium]